MFQHKLGDDEHVQSKLHALEGMFISILNPYDALIHWLAEYYIE